MACSCAQFDPDNGRYDCSVSGDGCMYLIPDSEACARDYGEGPDANGPNPSNEEEEQNGNP